KVVLSDRSSIRAGGRVVKNVAGYDLSKLFTGSFGSLGIITELNFKLRPRPSHEFSIISCGTPPSLVHKARRIMDLQLFPAGLELVSSRVKEDLGVKLASGSAALLIRFA